MGEFFVMCDNILRFDDNGHLLVVTDIHGNLRDFKKYIRLWDNKSDDYHILFTGDLIHEHNYDDDFSVDILDMMLDLNDNPRFHVLLGNHELYQCLDEEVCKYNINLTDDFKSHVKDKYCDGYIERLNEYICFMQGLPYFAITSNQFFISHAGVSSDCVSKCISNKVDLFNLSCLNYYDNNNSVSWKDYFRDVNFLDDFVWSRPYSDYSERDIDLFLDFVGCRFSVVGHTVYNGFHVFGNQLIFDSSFCTDSKYYLDIDLACRYDSIFDVVKCLHSI